MFESELENENTALGAGAIIGKLKRENEILKNALMYIRDNHQSLTTEEIIEKSNNAISYRAI